MKNRITIIIPSFNEEEAIPLFYNRLRKVLDSLSGQYLFTILFTNNASTDGTLREIHKIREFDPRVEVLTLSRNFGYQASLVAGLTHAVGDGFFIVDVDGEDPPELLPIFLSKWEEGNQIVYGIRGERPEPSYLTTCRRLFYKLLRAVADSDIVLNMAEFSLFSERVRTTIIANSNTFPFLRAEIAYSGFRKCGVPYDRQPRIAGKTHYNLFRMFLFAVAGLMSVSTFPFRLAAYILPFIGILNLLALIWTGCTDYLFPLLCAFTLDLFYLMAAVCTVGLYLARCYKNGISRPIFIIDWSESTISPH